MKIQLLFIQLWRASLIMAMLLLSASYASAQWPLQEGYAVMACFSGYNNPRSPSSGIKNDYVLGVYDVRQHQSFNQTSNSSWMPAMYHHPSWKCGDSTTQGLGQIFGVEISGQGDIFVSATSSYRTAQIGVNEPGLFGFGGPGAIYKIDGQTGIPSLFVALPNRGSGLGNIAYDPWHEQLFATNFDNGKIYQIGNLGGTSGVVIDSFQYVGTQTSVSSHPNFVPLGKRPWGITVHKDTLFFSVWNEDQGRRNSSAANEIYTLQLSNGNFVGNTPILVISLPIFTGIHSNPVSDIELNLDGAKMIVAERSMGSDIDPYNTAGGSFVPHHSRALEYYKTTSNWTLNKRLYVGTSNSGNNSAGGIDYGFGQYDSLTNEVSGCDKLAWVSGDALIYHGATTFSIYGMAGINIQANSASNILGSSVFIDANGQTNNNIEKTSLGDIELYDRCRDLSLADPCSQLNIAADLTYAPGSSIYSVDLQDISTLDPSGQFAWIEWYVDSTLYPAFAGDSRTMVFPGPGSYIVCLHVYAFAPDGNGGQICCKDSICDTITISICDYHRMAMQVDTDTSLTAVLTDSSGYSSRSIWMADITDSSSLYITLGAGTSISHTYPAAGTYTARLVSWWYYDGVLCCIDTIFETVTVGGGPAPAPEYCDSMAVTMMITPDTLSYDHYISVLMYSPVPRPAGRASTWYTVDGILAGLARGTPGYFTHTFPGPGTYVVCGYGDFSSLGGSFCTDSFCQTIIVLPIGPTPAQCVGHTANILFNTRPGFAANFGDFTTLGDRSEWSFNPAGTVDDTSSGNGSIVTHTFANAGPHTVRLYSSHYPDPNNLSLVCRDTTSRIVSFPTTISGRTIQIAPNPATKSARISYAPQDQTVQFSLIDIQGHTVQRWEDDGDGETTVEVGALPKGMYMIRLDAGETKDHAKLIKN